MEKLKCLQCGYEWVPRVEKVNKCPKCLKRNWNEVNPNLPIINIRPVEKEESNKKIIAFD